MLILFKIKIFRKETPKGEIKSEKKLSAKISTIDLLGGLSLKVEREIILRSGIRKVITPFAKGIERLLVRYRFVEALTRILSRFSAVGGTAQTEEVAIDQRESVASDSTAGSHEAEEVTASRNIIAQISAIGNGYRRAGAAYDRGILVRVWDTLIAAAGSVLSYTKAITQQNSYNAASAEANELEQDSKIVGNCEIIGETAPSESAAAEDAFTNAHSGEIGYAGTIDANAATDFRSAKSAVVGAWFLPDLADGVLTLYQMFSGVQSEETLAVDMENESVFWANAFNEGGTLKLVFTETVTPTGNILEVS